MDMGITRRTRFFVRKVAPFGDSGGVTVRGYELAEKSGRGDDRGAVEGLFFCESGVVITNF